MTILLFMILLLHPMALNFSIENDFNVLRNLIANESYEDAKNMIQQNKGVTNYSPYEDDSSPLSIAIEKGKVNLVQDMLIKKVPINQLLYAGHGCLIGNALSIAIKYKQLKIAKLLVQNNIELLDLKYPLLYEALINNDYSMANYLSTINHPNINGEKNIYITTGLLVKAMNKKAINYMKKRYHINMNLLYDNKTLFWVITDSSGEYYPRLNVEKTITSFKFLIKNGANIHHINNQNKNIYPTIINKNLFPQDKIESLFKFLSNQQLFNDI